MTLERGLLVMIALLACARQPSGPAWPEPSTTEEDGGESIAPRSDVSTALEAENDTPKQSGDELRTKQTAAMSSSEKKPSASVKEESKPPTTPAPQPAPRPPPDILAPPPARRP